MKDWRNFMVNIMKELGKESNLTQDIYPLVSRKNVDLPKDWKEGVRATLERNSSDCINTWNGKYDLFELKEKGSGNWILRNLVNTNIIQKEFDEIDENTGSDETNIKLTWHYKRERNNKLAKKKKELTKKEKGFLECEVCNFIFKDLYGERGEDFIECHHIVPLSELEPGTLTTLDDLALLCSNCHRMIHKKPNISLDELKQEISKH
jgi:putative restriction endonuclease